VGVRIGAGDEPDQIGRQASWNGSCHRQLITWQSLQRLGEDWPDERIGGHELQQPPRNFDREVAVEELALAPWIKRFECNQWRRGDPATGKVGASPDP
jgi:hypothetical protein